MAIGRKVLMGTALAGAFGAGMFKKVANGTIDNAMDIAFDNPQADQAVLGTDLTPSLALAGGVSGAAGLPFRFANAGALSMYGANSLGTMAKGGVVAGGLGGLGGALGGGILGGKKYGIKGAIGGAIAGGIGGASIGAGSVGMIGMREAAGNAQKYGRSGNSSLMTAQALNANGNIVLGMHNSRRG
jgi:hypothetical protein